MTSLLLEKPLYIVGILVLHVLYRLSFTWAERLLGHQAEVTAFEANNDASYINRGGAYLGLTIAVTLGPLLLGTDKSYWSGLGSFFASGLITIVAFVIMHHVLDGVILRGDNNAVKIRGGNVQVAGIEAAAYVAIGIVISGAFAGGGQPFLEGIGSALLFTLLGVIVLMAIYTVYKMSWGRSGDNIDVRIKNGDTAAALDAGSVLVAVAITLFVSIAGDYTGWANDLQSFGMAALTSTTFVLVARFIAGKILARAEKGSSHLGRSYSLAAFTIGIGLVAALA